jgi:pyridinium-3,5-biscarboxylic acid mononucleotide synthase
MLARSTREILERVRSGKLSVSKAEKVLKLDALSIVDEIARLDPNRYLRRGVPEIVYAKGKTPKQLQSIISSLLKTTPTNRISTPIILSKVSEDQANFLRSKFSAKLGTLKFKYFREASIVAFVPGKGAENSSGGRVALIAAGTSDIAVLNESEVILQLLGCITIRFNDLGIAALRRLSSPLKQIERFDPDCIIVAAGMEGALPSLIASLASVPIIGLPTSVGYGYGKGGEAALMSMLQACPLGICVVNIDGGVAAGIIATLIARRSSHAK